MTAPTVAAIVFSYSRPRMLAEAMSSVCGFDEVVVYDDGSDDRDAIADAADYGIHKYQTEHPVVVWGGRISPEFRMVTPRFGKAVNAICRGLKSDLVTYLCDDDIWAPDWADNIRRWWEMNPEQVVARARWMKFEDGQDPFTQAVECPLDPRGVTAGNFAHSRQGFIDRGIGWSEKSVTIHDDPFLSEMHKHGVNMYKIPFMKFVLAGYRRQHAHNMLNHLDGRGRYKPHVQEMFEAGSLEA